MFHRWAMVFVASCQSVTSLPPLQLWLLCGICWTCRAAGDSWPWWRRACWRWECAWPPSWSNPECPSCTSTRRSSGLLDSAWEGHRGSLKQDSQLTRVTQCRLVLQRLFCQSWIWESALSSESWWSFPNVWRDKKALSHSLIYIKLSCRGPQKEFSLKTWRDFFPSVLPTMHFLPKKPSPRRLFLCPMKQTHVPTFLWKEKILIFIASRKWWLRKLWNQKEDFI